MCPIFDAMTGSPLLNGLIQVTRKGLKGACPSPGCTQHPFALRQLQMKGSDPFSEHSDQVGHTKPMGGASLALIRRQEAEENGVCFSSGNKQTEASHSAVSLRTNMEESLD